MRALLWLGGGASLALAALQNRTIDDTNGDSVTGAKPVYYPPGPWQGPSCTGCAIQPDVGQVFEGTYSAMTYRTTMGVMNITMDFTGTAIYVYFVLANYQGPGVTTETEAAFTVDGVQHGSFSHVPTTVQELLYNQLVFRLTGLQNAPHTLVVATQADTDLYLVFDYAIYTFEDVGGTTPAGTTLPPPPTHSSAPPLPTSLPSSTQPQSTSSAVSVLLPSPLSSASSTPAAASVYIFSDLPPTPSPSHSPSPSPSLTPHPHPAAPVIAGSAVAGVVVLLALLFGFWLWRRRRTRQPQPPVLPYSIPAPPPPTSTMTEVTSTTDIDATRWRRIEALEARLQAVYPEPPPAYKSL
ncbi:hypothetical protein MIND_00837900 [Mycena indigotica]|uniref:Uncharacterized protein n=1 Tax=Mycena indigotica TaxID=2126181 RepID=A0A8H6W4F6_9AGAR|nr:uncharacterized protein MIND_00837900 [Mycena indigotica]KAF7298899.1 hypothetical protein MIND_00837900 [Mycena indigotica]